MVNKQLTKEGFTTYTIRNIPEDLHKRMKALAAREGTTLRVWMLSAFKRVALEQVRGGFEDEKHS